LTESLCDFAENKLTVINNQPVGGVKKTFGVCSKFSFFNNIKYTIRFIEWIELLRILGAHKIMLMNKHIQKDHLRIFDHYQKKGIVDYLEYNNPSGIKKGSGTFNMRQREIIETLLLNDCFYKTKNL
jgi:hypothetical protein